MPLINISCLTKQKGLEAYGGCECTTPLIINLGGQLHTRGVL